MLTIVSRHYYAQHADFCEVLCMFLELLSYGVCSCSKLFFFFFYRLHSTSLLFFTVGINIYPSITGRILGHDFWMQFILTERKSLYSRLQLLWKVLRANIVGFVDRRKVKQFVYFTVSQHVTFIYIFFLLAFENHMQRCQCKHLLGLKKQSNTIALSKDCGCVIFGVKEHQYLKILLWFNV